MTLALGPTATYASAVWPERRLNVAAPGTPPLWVAGIDERTAAMVHVEWIADPATSPLVQSSAAPDAVRRAAVIDLVVLFGRYREVLDDAGNPLTAVRIITNDAAAVPFLSWVCEQSRCRGAVEVQQGRG